MDKQAERISRSRKAERRSEVRDSLAAEVSILCEDEQGHEIVYHAKLLDVSAHGARFLMLCRLPLRSSVVFYHLKFGVGGRGTVRYCNSSNKGYEIGVEFRHGTGWSKPLPSEELKRLCAVIDPAEPVATPREVNKAE